MPTSQTIQTALEQLFPATAAVHCSASRPDKADLFPAELAATLNMVTGRKLEYAHGRSCARKALTMLGIEPTAIPTGAKREPLWPADIVGSISHTATTAAAVVARQSELTGIGLDMETDEPLDADLIAMICREDEQIGHDGLQAKLLFSIKEAIYKCIYPSIQEFIDFQEMKVSLNHGKQSFTAESHSPACERGLTDRLQGAYRITDGLVLSGAWLD